MQTGLPCFLAWVRTSECDPYPGIVDFLASNWTETGVKDFHVPRHPWEWVGGYV